MDKYSLRKKILIITFFCFFIFFIAMLIQSLNALQKNIDSALREEINLVSEALKFMGLGMGIVFLFLTIMIFILKLQAFLIAKFFSTEEKEKVNSWTPEKTVTTDDIETTAAITAAIIHYNNQKGN